jgi:hypothetical protein
VKRFFEKKCMPINAKKPNKNKIVETPIDIPTIIVNA